jgi:hypothetical protein
VDRVLTEKHNRTKHCIDGEGFSGGREAKKGCIYKSVGVGGYVIVCRYMTKLVCFRGAFGSRSEQSYSRGKNLDANGSEDCGCDGKRGRGGTFVF